MKLARFVAIVALVIHCLFPQGNAANLVSDSSTAEIFRSFNASRDAPVRLDGSCAFRGTCGNSTSGCTPMGACAPCKYDGAPQAPTFDMSEWCPEFQDSACCDQSQYQAITDNIGQVQSLFSACPACVDNFRKLICTYTCSPNQGEFITLTKTAPWSDGDEQVIFMDYRLIESFAQGLYDNCKDVQFGSAGSTVLVALFQAYSATDWFEKIFSYPDTSPVGVNVIQTPEAAENVAVLNTTMCNDPAKRCSCADCQLSCSSSQLPLPEARSHHPPSVHAFGTEIEDTEFAFGIIWIVVSAGAIVLFFMGPLALYVTKLGNHWSNHDGEEDTLADALNIKKDSAEYDPGALDRPLLDEGPVGEHRLPPGVAGYLYRLGSLTARKPLLFIAGALVAVGACIPALCTGMLQVETDPVKLWASPTSATVRNKEYFDEHFGPFFRIEEIIMPAPNSGQVITADYIVPLMQMQNEIQNTVVTMDDGTIVGWKDLCFQPIPNGGCLVQSVTEFFQNNITFINDWEGQGFTDQTDYIRSHVSRCLSFPSYTDCMSSIGLPQTNINTLFGGVEGGNYINATALVVTYLMNNDPSLEEKNKAWEAEIVKVMESWSDRLDIAYSTERSVQDELAKETDTDIPTIAISYIVMFLYVGFALGKFIPVEKSARFFVRTKFALGLAGVVLVLFSLVISVGICTYAGIKATLIISEVIPFIVLAIGVDNVFILHSAFENTLPSDPLHHRMGMAMASVGLSIICAALSEAFAFALGALTSMPAVQAFALYSAVAILADLLLQMTVFSALITLDAKRADQQRIDCIPCISVGGFHNRLEDFSRESRAVMDASGQTVGEDRELPFLARLFRDKVAPFLLDPRVKVGTIIVFFAWWIVAGSFVNKIELGLPQDEALPSDSFLKKYFAYLADYLQVGPPVYFVVKSGQGKEFLDYSDYALQNKICSKSSCDSNSLGNTIGSYSRAPNVTWIASPLSSWLDDYLAWIVSRSCCRFVFCESTAPFTDGRHYCPPITTAEFPDDIACENCDGMQTCVSSDELRDNCQNNLCDRASRDHFDEYFPVFLNSSCGDACGSCGNHYHGDIAPLATHNGINVNYFSVDGVSATRYTTYHPALRTQSDFINALEAAYDLADDLSKKLDLEIFPFSSYYVFFEQYLHIKNIAGVVLGCAMAVVAIVTLVLFRSPVLTVIIVLIVALVELGVAGIMGMWDISFNAVSVVNMVSATGIAVEFCVHLCHSFAAHGGTRDERVEYALTHIGSAVFSGITITKFCGVSVLAFARSEIFVVYYFRMYLGIVVLGATHGLILLPVVLSLFGPSPSLKVKHDNACSPKGEGVTPMAL